MDRHSAQQVLTMIGRSATTVVVVAFSLLVPFTAVYADVLFAGELCGEGAAPDYGFTYQLQQAHWTVDWQDYVSEMAVAEVDAVLDRLNDDFIAQTMILLQPQDQVGNRVNCAVHFLRYMGLGQLKGERSDNGFVFLIVVEPERIDVHYGVGLGLPALTAPELTALNRAAEEAYQSTGSLDQALLTLVYGFDTVARSKYPPLISPAPTPATTQLPALPTGPLGILALCGLLCFGAVFLLILMWALTQVARRGIAFNPPGSGLWGGGTGMPSDRGWGGFGGGRGGGLGGGRSAPPTRGGGGSGRSGRGN